MLGRPDPYVHRTGRGRQMLGALAGIQTPTYQIVAPRAAWWWRVSRWAARTALRMVRRVARRLWGRRRILAPWFLAAAIWVAAALAHLADKGWVTIATLGLAGAPAVWWWLGLPMGRVRRRRGLPTDVQRWWYGGAYVAAAMWATVAARWGAGPPRLGWLLVLAAVCWAAWCWHHRVRPTTAQTADDRIADWAGFIGQSGPGAGSELANLEQTDYGWRGTVTVPRGKKASALITLAEEVASTYDRETVADVALEQFTARKVRLTVYERNPLREVKYWPGPTLFDREKGVATIGTYADGGSAMYRFYKRGSGPVHDLIAGTTDGGKSRLVDQLLAIERADPNMASVVIDPQMGQSLPEWKRQVAVYARGVDEGIDVLAAVHTEMLRRNRLLSDIEWADEHGRQHDGIDHFDPLHPVIQELGMKLICLTIEEASAMLKTTGVVDIVEDIGKMARKCGIKLRLVVQVPLLDQLGGSSTLRDMVVAGNVVVLRTANPLTGQVAFNGTLPVDPALLPREWPDGSTTAGLGFVLGPGARSVPMRTWLVDDTYHWAHEGETTELPGLNLLAAMAHDLRATKKANAEQQKPAATLTQPAARGTAFDRIAAYLASTEDGRAHTGVIASALDIPLPRVSEALGRAAKKGIVRQVRTGVWALADAQTNEEAA